MSISARISAISDVLIGLIPALVIGGVAWGVGQTFPILGGPVVAILIGLVVGQILGQRKEWAAGVKFASKTFYKPPLCYWALECRSRKWPRSAERGCQ